MLYDNNWDRGSHPVTEADKQAYYRRHNHTTEGMQIGTYLIAIAVFVTLFIVWCGL